MLTLWIECLKMGLRELSRHRLRSGLTMLGMLMGVAVVIVCVSGVQGVKDSLIGDIRKAGRNMIIIINQEPKKGRAQGAGLHATNLTRADAEAIATECDAISYACPTHGDKVQAVSSTGNTVLDIAGATHTYTAIRNWGVSEGRDLEPFDIVSGRRVCLIGQSAMKELFGGQGALNQTVRVGRMAVKVVGVLDAKGVNPLGMDEDNVIVAPLPVVLREVLGVREPSVILCSATSDA